MWIFIVYTVMALITYYLFDRDRETVDQKIKELYGLNSSITFLYKLVLSLLWPIVIVLGIIANLKKG